MKRRYVCSICLDRLLPQNPKHYKQWQWDHFMHQKVNDFCEGNLFDSRKAVKSNYSEIYFIPPYKTRTPFNYSWLLKSWFKQ